MPDPGDEPDLPTWVAETVSAARAHPEDVDRALEICRRHGAALALPDGGDTATRLAVLSALARADLTLARVFEAHTDALAILAEHAGSIPAADDPDTDTDTDTDTKLTWGVFAAEGPRTRLDAEPAPGGRVLLSGTKPWCSLGGRLDAALVTAHAGGDRQLFRVDLHEPGVRAAPPDGWVARGLRVVTSGPVHFDAVPADPVGAPGWYLQRPGFAWGGIGVAACWHGGAQGVADTLRRTAATRDSPLDALHLGSVDVALHASGAVLAAAAAEIDASARPDRVAPPGRVGDPALLAARTRAVVAESVERVLHHAGHALGPAALAFDAEHARRVADLQLYVRQHHGERDLAALGQILLDRRR